MLTPETLLQQWLRDLQADRASSTVYRYAGAIAHFLTWYHEHEHRPLTLTDLTPIALVGYRMALQQTAKPSTVNTHVCALRAWCAWLQEQGYLEVNPARRFKLVHRQAAAAPRGLTPAQANALLRAATRTRHPERDVAIVQLLLQSGIRIGECAALTWHDIVIGEKSGQIEIRAGKGNKARTVPLNASARQALADYVAPLLGVASTLKAVAAAWPRQHDTPSPPLWRSQKAGRLTTSAIGRMIDGLVRDSAARGLVPVTTSAHTLRHTFAHRYLAAHPDDLVGLAALLGHSTLETTRIYVQPTAEELANRMEQIDLNAYAG